MVRRASCCLLMAVAAGWLMSFSPVSVALSADHTQAEADLHEGGGGHAVDDAHHGASGKSELPLDYKQDLAFWSLITFFVFVFLLKKIAWQPLIAGLDNRESGLRENVARAEAARTKAELLLSEHEQKLAKAQDEVREIIAEARRDADITRQDIIATAQKEAELTKQRAITEIEQATSVALKEIFDSMAGQVSSATEHVLGRSLNEGDQGRLIDDALSQFSAGNS